MTIPVYAAGELRELAALFGVVSFFWAVLVTVLLCLHIAKSRMACRKLNELLDKIIDGVEISELSFNESELSMFSNQLKTIAGKFDVEIGRADFEKEQIKQLISNMSHQLKTPLANVMMYEELLDSNALTEVQRRDFMRKLRAQSEKISWLLESLFKMSRLEQNVIEFDLARLEIKDTIRSAVSAIYEKAEKKNIEIRVAEFGDVMLLHNPKWTSEVFVNLLENAVKYTPASGQIEISLECLENYSVIHIKDNGMGIPREDIPYIFNRFYRSDAVEEIEGSGIGLYLSKMILEKEKGYMTVKSEPGVGSVFSVFLQNC